MSSELFVIAETFSINFVNALLLFAMKKTQFNENIFISMTGRGKQALLVLRKQAVDGH